jgi:DNA-binding MarR family transcriptional regulator
MDVLKVLEKQSGFLRLLVYLLENGEKQITDIINNAEIPVHQLYASIEKGKELGLINTRIDNSIYPARNLVYLTERGIKIAEKIKEIIEIIMF